MPEYLAPGVYVEEVSFTPSQIAPASTSIAAIVGPTRTGPVRGQPQLLTSFNDYLTYFGDVENLSFIGAPTSVLNYTAYSARAFFDNGGQLLYLTRVVSDIAQQGLISLRATTASLNIPPTGTALATIAARFPGAYGNLTLVLTSRRSPKLLQVAPAAAAAPGPLLLRLTNVNTASLTNVSPALPANTVLPSLVALVNPPGAGPSPSPSPTPSASPTPSSSPSPTPSASPTPSPSPSPAPAAANYSFVAGVPVIYIDPTGLSHAVTLPALAAVPATIATGQGANLSTVTSPSATTFPPATTNWGQAPLYSIPLGPAACAIFGLAPAGAPAVLYATVEGNNFTAPRALNAALSADATMPLAVLALPTRIGDGNIYHDSYDISVRSNGLEIYSFAAVDLESDSPQSIYSSLAATPTGSAAASQPVSAAMAAGETVVTASAFMAGLQEATALWASQQTPPVPPPANFTVALAGGSDGSPPQFADYVGEVDQINGSYGLAALESVDDISMVLCPAAAADPNVHQAVITAIQAHCDKMLYRVGIIEAPPGSAVADAQSFAGQFSDSRLAYYYPWIQVASLAATGGNILLPPSGFMAGLYANTDITRGVQKAPANEVVVDAVGLETYINTQQQMVLNPLGVNCIRSFPGRGILVWGARTLSPDPQWQYVNVRRYFLYLEQSIADSTSWVVFEPNGPALWSAVAGTVSDFLYNEWFNGRLFGARPADAYFVRCDQTTMTEADLANGRLICVIGVAPLEPAEFVIFRIGQWTASAS